MEHSRGERRWTTRPDRPKPIAVRRWERVAQEAGGPTAATAQLVYEMLRQIRTIKLILAWVLVVLPAMAVALIIVLNVLASQEVPSYSPYGY